MLNNNSSKIFSTAGLLLAVSFFISFHAAAQQKWINVSADYAPLPPTIQVFKTTDSLDGKPFIAFYVKAKLKDKSLDFTTDTTLGRRLTPAQFYKKNDSPLVVVNGTFFSFETNQNLNVVIKEGSIVSYTVKKIKSKSDSTIQLDKPMIRGAIGINKKGEADIAWIKTDSTKRYVYAKQSLGTEFMRLVATDVDIKWLNRENKKTEKIFSSDTTFKKWKVRTAIGGGPVLIQKNTGIDITNNQEELFVGKAINDKHPRTCIGYTNEKGFLIIMVIQGRFPGIAEGATLQQEAKLLRDLGCMEALNLDGGGSSCLLVNGKETIKPSTNGEERPVPAVFIVTKK